MYDITNNNGYKIVAVDDSIVSVQFKNNSNVLAVTSGNYALAYDISISSALAIEDKDSPAAITKNKQNLY